MDMKWRYVLLAAAVASMLAVTACGTKQGGGAAQPAGGTPSGTSQGAAPQGGTTPSGGTSQGTATKAVDAESIVKQNCIGCHGDTLDGKGSANKNLQKIGAKLTKEQIANQINNGGNGMPGLRDKLKAEEVAAVAEWLAAKK